MAVCSHHIACAMPYTVIVTLKIRCTAGLEWKGRGWMSEPMLFHCYSYNVGILIMQTFWNVQTNKFMLVHFWKNCFFFKTFHLQTFKWWALSQHYLKSWKHTAERICNCMFCSLYNNHSTTISSLYTWHHFKIWLLLFSSFAHVTDGNLLMMPLRVE